MTTSYESAKITSLPVIRALKVFPNNFYSKSGRVVTDKKFCCLEVIKKNQNRSNLAASEDKIGLK